jgi:hypothetical protein
MEENMSLINEMKVACVLLDKQRMPDGEGGFVTKWVEGAKFMAGIVQNTTIEARIAEKQGVTSIYTVDTDKNAILEYNDVFRRLYDGKVFRVTSNGKEKKTPDSATINISQVTAEEWRLPDEN